MSGPLAGSGRLGATGTVFDRVERSLSWKLTVSHLIVTLISTFIFGFGIYVMIFGISATSGSGISSYGDFIYGTVVIAFVGGVYLALVGTVGAVISGIAGFRLARRFGRRIEAMEVATEEIARGNLQHRVAIVSQDEFGRLAQRFNLLASRLEAIEEGRRAFVSNVSHDLRTPIAVIRGHVEAQIARSDGSGPTATVDEALRVIEREARTLQSLIDDLFTLTRLEEAALPFLPSRVDLPNLIDEAVQGIKPLAYRQSKVGVSSQAPPDLPPVTADPTRVTQVLNNLLYNALRHTPRGGVIVVEAETLAGGGEVEVRVVDTGTGIEADKLPHIFDRFYRGGAAREDGGSGLGLAIVKQLVEAQGGRVRAESLFGTGTSICFTLPVATTAAARPRPRDWQTGRLSRSMFTELEG